MDELITLNEAVEILGRGRRTLFAYLRAGLLTVRGQGASVRRGPKPQMVSRAEVEALKAAYPPRGLPRYADDPDSRRQRILARCIITADGCWQWTGAMAGGRVPTLHLGCDADGHQQMLTVRPWLFEHDMGYALPKRFQRPCEKDHRCINPAHNGLKYDAAIVQYAVQALKAGHPIVEVAKQYGLPVSLVELLLDDQERESVRHAKHDRSFWALVDMTGEHWILLKRQNVIHEGKIVQARHKAWRLSGRTLGEEMTLRATCGVEACIKPECQREIYAPGMRTNKHTRGAKVAKRHAAMAELVLGCGWTYQGVADMFGCSEGLVGHAVKQAREMGT